MSPLPSLFWKHSNQSFDPQLHGNCSCQTLSPHCLIQWTNLLALIAAFNIDDHHLLPETFCILSFQNIYSHLNILPTFGFFLLMYSQHSSQIDLVKTQMKLFQCSAQQNSMASYIPQGKRKALPVVSKALPWHDYCQLSHTSLFGHSGPAI